MEHQAPGVIGAPRLAGNPSNIQSWIVCDVVKELWSNNDCTVTAPVSDEFPEFPFMCSWPPQNPYGDSLSTTHMACIAYTITRSVF
jgi:hypothetical protein